MRVLVTGATGFIGFHTVLALLDAGHTVRFGARSQRKLRRLYEPLGIDTSDAALGEITDRALIDRALEDCDGVVHTAAMVSLDASKADLMYHTNVIGTERVIGGAVQRGIESIVHVSSAAALFRRGADVMDENAPVAQSDSAYGRSKAESERYVRALMDDGAPIAVTYPASVIGPRDPAMSEGNQGLALLFNAGMVITSSGMQIIDVRDLAAAHVALLEQGRRGRYLVAGHYRSWQELAPLLERVTGRRLRRIPAPGWLVRGLGAAVDLVANVVPLETPLTREGAIYGTCWVYADDRKLRRELQMQYRPLEDTLADTVRWLAEEGVIESWWAERLPEVPDQSPR